MINHIRGAAISWTIKFNVWICILVQSLPMLQDSFPQLQPYIPANLFQVGMAILIVGNIVLRFKTNGSLADKVKKDPPTT